MGRPGTAYLGVECRDGEPALVWVGGDAVVVIRGEIDLEGRAGATEHRYQTSPSTGKAGQRDSRGGESLP